MLQQYLQAIGFRITEGYQFQWNSYGRDSYGLEHDSGDGTYYTQCIFDTNTTELYEVTMIDYSKEHAYIWINPEYHDAYFEEAASRNVNPLEVVDGLNYVEVCMLDDIIDKVTAMCNNVEYDTRVSFPLDLPDDLYDELLTIADKKSVTVEKLIEDVLTESMTRYETSNNL